MRIFIGADIVPTDNNIEYFTQGDTNELLGEELINELESCDFRVFNLETPLCDTVRPIEKVGPCHNARTNTVHGLKAIKCDLLTLANNHIMDQGNDGIRSTIDILNKYNICWFGIGENSRELRKSYIHDFNGYKIAFYACAEHEFSIAEERKPGANPFDPLYSFDEVKALKQNSDLVIVLFHGGKEYYRYPSPFNQRVAHKFVESGADYFIMQHSHCLGTIEYYQNGVIVYGQGNFIFHSSDNKLEDTSIGIIIDIIDKKHFFSYIPLIKNNIGIRIAHDKMAEQILSSIIERTNQIKIEGFIEKQYKQFVLTKTGEYLNVFSGNHFFSRLLRKLFGDKLIIQLYSKKSLLRMQNFLECEAHYEVFLKILKYLGSVS